MAFRSFRPAHQLPVINRKDPIPFIMSFVTALPCVEARRLFCESSNSCSRSNLSGCLMNEIASGDGRSLSAMEVAGVLEILRAISASPPFKRPFKFENKGRLWV